MLVRNAERFGISSLLLRTLALGIRGIKKSFIISQFPIGFVVPRQGSSPIVREGVFNDN